MCPVDIPTFEKADRTIILTIGDNGRGLSDREQKLFDRCSEEEEWLSGLINAFWYMIGASPTYTFTTVNDMVKAIEIFEYNEEASVDFHRLSELQKHEATILRLMLATGYNENE